MTLTGTLMGIGAAAVGLAFAWFAVLAPVLDKITELSTLIGG